MLSLQLKDGEYLTIGEDIVIRVFTNSTIKMSVQAPRHMAILRGEVLERNGENRPDCLCDHLPAKMKKAAHRAAAEPKPSEAGLVRRGEAAK